MNPDLTDIARGRRIVALAARDLHLIRRTPRPVRRRLMRLIARFMLR